MELEKNFSSVYNINIRHGQIEELKLEQKIKLESELDSRVLLKI